MAKWALIINGVVAEVTEENPVGRYHESLAWVECGEDVAVAWDYDGFRFSEPEGIEVVVPLAISPRQGMIMLSRAGLLTTVNAAIDSIEGQAGEEARIDFDRAAEWRRDWPLLNQLASGLGLTAEQIDQLFITAATL